MQKLMDSRSVAEDLGIQRVMGFPITSIHARSKLFMLLAIHKAPASNRNMMPMDPVALEFAI